MRVDWNKNPQVHLVIIISKEKFWEVWKVLCYECRCFKNAIGNFCRRNFCEEAAWLWSCWHYKCLVTSFRILHGGRCGKRSGERGMEECLFYNFVLTGANSVINITVHTIVKKKEHSIASCWTQDSIASKRHWP